jgi:dTMP kinase
MTEKGRLFVLEGGEGSGKSTQAALLARHLCAEITREPGGTPLGEHIRTALLNRDLGMLDARAELFMMIAARAQHVTERIRPALFSGRDVVCDRFSGSTLAYQGFGRGIALEEVQYLCALAAGGIEPDLTILLDVPQDVATQRRHVAPDRIEAEDSDFHARVIAGYREIALSNPNDWVIVDASGTPEDIAVHIAHLIDERFGPSPTHLRRT